MKSKIQTLFDKSNIQKTLLNSIFVLYIFSILQKLIAQFFFTYHYESWQVTEWLINYQAGYVRRGLVGEIIFFFAKNFNINVELTIKIFSLICFAVLITFFVRSFLKKGYALYILPLCFLFGTHFLNGMYWQKRDYLIFIFLIAIFKVYNLKQSIFLKFVGINILMILALQVHEALAFFSLPFLFLMFLNEFKQNGWFKSFLYAGLFLLPSVIVFLLTLKYHGNMQTAQTIWDSWVKVSHQTPAELSDWSHGALSAIGWTREMAFEFHYKMNFWSESAGITSVVFWIIIIPLVYYITSNFLLVFSKAKANFSIQDRTILSSILIFQLVCLSPFFIRLSCDLGRILFYWVASSFVIFLLCPKEKLASIFPPVYIRMVEKLNHLISIIIRPSKTSLTLLMLFIGLPTAGFLIDHVVESSVIGNLMMLFSKIAIAFK